MADGDDKSTLDVYATEMIKAWARQAGREFVGGGTGRGVRVNPATGFYECAIAPERTGTPIRDADEMLHQLGRIVAKRVHAMGLDRDESGKASEWGGVVSPEDAGGLALQLCDYIEGRDLRALAEHAVEARASASDDPAEIAEWAYRLAGESITAGEAERELLGDGAWAVEALQRIAAWMLEHMPDALGKGGDEDGATLEDSLMRILRERAALEAVVEAAIGMEAAHVDLFSVWRNGASTDKIMALDARLHDSRHALREALTRLDAVKGGG